MIFKKNYVKNEVQAIFSKKTLSATPRAHNFNYFLSFTK